MKELLKLLPILGLTTLMSLAIGCPGTADMGDDTPPTEEELPEEDVDNRSDKEKETANAIAEQLKKSAGGSGGGDDGGDDDIE